MDLLGASTENLARFDDRLPGYTPSPTHHASDYLQKQACLSVHNLKHGAREDEHGASGAGDAERGDAAAAGTVAPDGGYGWVVVACASVLSFLGTFMWGTFGMYYIAYSYHFRDSKAYLPWIYSVQCMAYIVSGLYFGSLYSTLGGRLLAVVFTLCMALSSIVSALASHASILIVGNGFLAGTGYMGITLAYTVLVQTYFSTRRTLAMGIAICGSSVGMMVSPPLVNFLMEIYGWRGCLIIQSAICLHGLPVSLLLRPLRDSNSSRPGSKHIREPDKDSVSVKSHRSERKVSSRILPDFSVLKYPRFVTLAICHGVYSFCYLIPAIFSISRAVRAGVPPQQASFLMSSWAVGSALGRIPTGLLGDKMNRCLLYGAMVTLAGVITLVISPIDDYMLNMVYCASFGFLSGGIKVVQAPLSVDFVGVDKIHRAEPVNTVIMGFIVTGATPISEWLTSVTGSYVFSFLLGGAVCTTVGLLMTSIYVYDTFISKHLRERRGLKFQNILIASKADSKTEWNGVK